MLNENAKKWVEELRSGRWKQHTGALTNEDRTAFCCLGVACELALQAGVINPPVAENRVDGSKMYCYEGDELSELPLKVRVWLNVRYCNGHNDTGKSLVFLNDSGSTFEQLADFIESEPPGLFKE